MSGNKRKRRKIFLLIIVILITTVVLVVETYAWFVGLSTVNTSSFNISVSTGAGLEISLDGSTWKTGTGSSNTLTISSTSINAYTGHNNSWVDSNGLVPVSSSGILTSAGRLKIFEKSSLASTAGGYRLVASQIDNSTTEAGSYVAFDLFIRNGKEAVYSNDNYNTNAAENIYLTSDSQATVGGNGAANSLRVGFFEIAGMKAYNASTTDIRDLSCSTPTTANVKKALCPQNGTNRGHYWAVWEPSTAHTTNASTYFTNSCKKRNSDGTYQTASCTALSTSTVTYAIYTDIAASDDIDIYDGLNGYTSHTYNSTSNTGGKINNLTTYKKPSSYTYNNQIFRLAGNSITRVRVYIWLEGQDPDNYDVIVGDTNVTLKFGFTKDRYGLGT